MPEKDNYRMTTGRVQALTDGIYAIAMTILILNVEVPNVTPKSGLLIKSLIALYPQFFDFALSFLLLAIFWTVHHRHFHFIKKADSGLLWINVFTLLFVVLIPFSTSLFGEYRNLSVAAIFFELNILTIGILKFVQWSYISKRGELVSDELDRDEIALGKKINLVTPAVSVIAIFIAFFSPDNSTAMYMTVPLIIAVMRNLHRKK